ncbi:MAG: hypothetical protein AB8B99_07725 [Phormidesmis sp.]
MIGFLPSSWNIYGGNGIGGHSVGATIAFLIVILIFPSIVFPSSNNKKLSAAPKEIVSGGNEAADYSSTRFSNKGSSAFTVDTVEKKDVLPKSEHIALSSKLSEEADLTVPEIVIEKEIQNVIHKLDNSDQRIASYHADIKCLGEETRKTLATLSEVVESL